MPGGDEIEALAATLRSTDPLARAEAVAALRRIESRGKPDMKKKIVGLFVGALLDGDPAVRDAAFFGLLGMGLDLDPDLRRRTLGSVERIQLMEIGRVQVSPGQLDRLLKGYQAPPAESPAPPPASPPPTHAEGPPPKTAAPETKGPAVDGSLFPPALANPKEKLLLQMLNGRIRQFFNSDLSSTLENAWRTGGSLNSAEFVDSCRAAGAPILFSLSQMLTAPSADGRKFAFDLLSAIGGPSLPYTLEALAESDRALRQIAYRLLFDLLGKQSKWTPTIQKLAYTVAATEETEARLVIFDKLRAQLAADGGVASEQFAPAVAPVTTPTVSKPA